MVFNTVFNSYFSYIVVASAPVYAFLEFFLPVFSHNILSKLLASFPHNHHETNGQWSRRNESCCNNYMYHQAWDKILVEPVIKPVTSCNYCTKPFTKKTQLVNPFQNDKDLGWSKFKGYLYDILKSQ